MAEHNATRIFFHQDVCARAAGAWGSRETTMCERKKKKKKGNYDEERTKVRRREGAEL